MRAIGELAEVALDAAIGRAEALDVLRRLHADIGAFLEKNDTAHGPAVGNRSGGS